LLIVVPNAKLIWSAIWGQPQVGLRCFISTTERIKSAGGRFGLGFVFCFGENSSRYLRWTSARWKFSNVDGSKAIATREKTRFDPKRTESGDKPIQNAQIGRTPTGMIKDQ
jgi:hypothetical protein